jgi:cytochrome c-type biogenesis protein CcmF
MDKFNDGNTLPGNLGHFFVILSFVAALVATYAYFRSSVAKQPEEQLQWRTLARFSFYAELIGVIGIICCLYFILYNHQYQYKFAYKHSDNSLPVKYLFSCFWEGQEGSFLVWIFWHSFLGLFVMHSAKSWEAPVMMVINFVQIFLTAFLLGIFFGDFHFGSSPFVLLRQSDLGIGPVFQQPNYLSMITDGRGLNKTLQDPWMVIHPPTLFFGYASCTIPMAFAVAALWKKDFTGWIKPALPWIILAASVLGVGILMGAKWAYQSLSFGGYWAWDPVENASLVPWLVLIAGMHTALIYKHTGNALRSSFLFITGTFIFVIYSTCLTRTGILGNTSVHAFTGGGLETQIWLLLAFVCTPPIYFLVKNYPKIPFIAKEEASWSREFWMFIGALVFFFSALFIILATSLPVFNKLFGLNWALGANAQAVYNKVHVPVIIIISVCIGITQYLKYKNTTREYLGKKLWLPVLISMLLSGLFLFFTGIHYTKQGAVFQWIIGIGLTAAIFAAVANIAYIVQVVKRKMMNWGSSLGHLGFGLLLIGILISASNQKILSINNPAVNVFGDGSTEDPRENLNLLKGLPVNMHQYKVVYDKDTADLGSKEKKQYYHVVFQDTAGKQSFVLKPSAYLNVMNDGKAGIQPNPDFKSYWNKDLFLYITSLLDPEKRDAPPAYIQNQLKIGDTGFLKNGFFILKRNIITSGKVSVNDNIFFKIETEVVLSDGKRFLVYPAFSVKNGIAGILPDSLPAEKLSFRIDGIADNQKIKFSVKDGNRLTDYITVKILEFPQINFMWLGIIIMSVGFMLSMIRRIRELNKSSHQKNTA